LVMNSFFKKITDDNYLKILLLVPILLVIINKDWIFSNAFVGFADEWIYTGYFVNFQQLYSNFGTDFHGTPLYFISRLSWILPGYLLHSLFSPVIANYILHLVFLYVAIISLYLILKIHFDEKTALFISILFCSYSHILWQMGSNYVTPAVVAYSLLTMLMVTLSAKETHWKIYSVFTGIFLGCMIITNMFSIVFIPFFCIYFFSISDPNQKKFILLTILYVIAGVCAISIFFATLYYLLIGDVFYFIPQILEIFNLSHGPIIAYRPIQDWITGASWLIFPGIVLMGSLIYIAFKWKFFFSPSERILVIFQINYIFLSSIFIIGEILGLPFSQLPYYAIYLVPFLFLALGSMISPILKRITVNEFFIIISAVIIFLPFMLLKTISSSIFSILDFNLLIISLTIPFLLLIITSSFFDQISKKKMLTCLITFCLLFGCLNSGLYSQYITQGFDSNENAYLAVMDSGSAIKEVFPTEPVKFWYNWSEVHEGNNYGMIFHSINSEYLAVYSYISTKFPYIDKNDVLWQIHNYGPENIVVISTDENGFTIAENSLNDPRLEVDLVETKKIVRGNIQFYLYFITVKENI